MTTDTRRVSRRIGEVLVRRGLIDRATLDRALELQTQERPARHRRLGQILADEFEVDLDTLNREYASYYGFPAVTVPEPLPEDVVVSSRSVLEGLSPSDRTRLLDLATLPLVLNGSDPVLFLSSSPTESGLSDLIASLGFDRFQLGFCTREEYGRLIQLVVPQSNEYLDMFREAAQGEIILEDESEDAEDHQSLIEVESHQSVLTNLVEAALVEAVHQGSSDIHMIPRAGSAVEFYFRVDGKLRLWHRQESVKPEAVSAVLKDRSQKVDRFEWDAAQDGFIQRRIDGHLIRYRVSILPIVSSELHRRFESVVVRILDDRKVITDLNLLGFMQQAREDFERAVSSPQGLVILTGPTGSGKSTTLVAALHQVLRPEVNVLTVEDPVEYHIAGARQIKLSPRLDFDGAIRAILRHDPDVVMVGEIRDTKTAEIAIKLANTGHLTFTTLHTNDAPSAVSRLYKMGVEPFLLANAVNIVVAQRLVRKLCPDCKALITDLDPRIPMRLGFTKSEVGSGRFYRAVGCSTCRTGYKGRMGIHETLLFTKKIRQMILTAAAEINEDGIRDEAIRNGMLTLRASGRQRILDGTTSLEEIALTTMEL